MSILKGHEELVTDVASVALLKIKESLSAPSKPAENPPGSGIGAPYIGGILSSADPATTAIRDALAVLSTLHGLMRPEHSPMGFLGDPNVSEMFDLVKSELKRKQRFEKEGEDWKDGEAPLE